MVKKVSYETLFFAICFIMLFLFFAYVHPLIPYDGDDWANLSMMRVAYPRWGIWNPIKILPETAMPLIGYISAYLFNPIVNDYITSITLCASIFFSALITLYLYFFYRFLKSIYELPNNVGIFITLLFLLINFLIFKSDKFNNMYMFYSVNLTCYFHYVLPALLNSILVLYLLKFKNLLKEKGILKNSLIIIGIYLSIFSNVFHSIMLITYIFIELLFGFINDKNIRSIKINELKIYIKENADWVLIITIWLLSLFFEANGGRATQIGHSIFELPKWQTLMALGTLLKQASKGFIAILIVGVLIALVIYIKTKNKTADDDIYETMTLKSLLCLLITVVYVVLISAKASPGYIAVTHVAFSFLFYLFILLFNAIAYIFKKYPKAVIVLPLVCFIIAIQTLNTDKHFRESNMRNIAPYKCVLIDNYLIEQVVEADKNGKKEMVLIVPKGDNRDNWPHPKYMGGNISRTLYAHGVISQDMKITIKPDENINKKFHLGYFK